MANLTFADSHNMVAYLGKLAKNADFTEIVDFLNANPIRQGKDFSGKVTPLFETMLIQHPAELDKTVYEKRRDIMERAATTGASLDVEHDSGTINRTQSTIIPNEPIHQGTGSGDSPRRQDTILGDRPAQTRVLALENNKTAQDLEITHLKKRVKRLEKKRNSRTLQLKRRLFKNAKIQGRYGHDIEINIASTSITTASINITIAEPVTTVSTPITTAGVSVSTAKPSTPPPTTTVIEDKDLIIAQTLMKLRKKEMMARQKEEDANITEWDDVQAIMDADHELAEQLQAEDQGELSIEESFEEVQKAFDKTMSWINSFVPMDKEVVEGSGKKAESSGKEAISKKRARKGLDEESIQRQKLEDDANKEELRACLEIVQHNDSAVNIESLATKYPIVDWKALILSEDMFYYRISRSDRSTKYYKIFRAMLDDFDKQYVLDLYKLVKERFKTTSPEGYDRLL
nr:hypothetical protein [Tanacetum cinerariifolium]